MGNIVEIFENGRSVCRHEYDALGRLTREDNVAFGKTTTWAYDNNGNIIARYEYAITTKRTSELHLLNGTCKLYTYDDNSDQLISYNGETFLYDTIGNPTTYRGKTAVWESGRQLTSFDGNTFAYDARGRRTAKNGITFTYDSNGNLIKQSNGLEFLYDHTGVFAVKHNGSTYFYRKDAQANIVALLDNNGSAVVKYKYDAWGKCKVLNANGSEITDSNHIGILNPFRYRSYYYDIGIGLYFLKTRYYDPEIGRFMTIDDISYLDPESINGLNLYAYCRNNPTKYIDPNGKAVITLSALLIAFAVGAILGGISGGISAAAQGQNVFAGIVTGALVGGLTGMLAEFSLPIALAGSFVVGLLGDVASQKFVEGKSFDNINLTQAVGVGLLNMVLTLPAVGLSRIVRNSGITNAQSFLFGLVSNAPLIGVSTMGNSLISQISTIFSIGHLKKNIISGILYILETHMKEIIINKKGYYCHAI